MGKKGRKYKAKEILCKDREIMGGKKKRRN